MMSVIITNCREYRKEMELLSLRTRIEKGISDPEELREVQERIRVLEKDLDLD